MKKLRMTRLSKFALLVGCVLLTSAYTEQGDSLDINQRLISTTIALDKKDGEIWVYLEYANIQSGQNGGGGGGGGGGAKKFNLVKSRGRTLPEVRLNLDRQLNKPLYISSLRLLLLTEDFAKEHLVEYLYRLRADETYRKKVITIITRDDVEALFKAPNDRDESLGNSAEDILLTLEAAGGCFTRTTSRLLENLSNDYTGILMPCIGLQEDKVAFTGYSVVKDDRVIGFLPVEACKGLNILKTDNAKTFYVVPYKGFQFTVETTLTERKIKAYYENGKPAFNILLKFDAALEYGDKKVPYHFSDADNEEMTGILKQMIELDVKEAIFQAQTTFKTDYLQLDDEFRVSYPVAFDAMDWNVAFGQATIATEAEVSLKSSTMIDYSVDLNG